MCVVSMVHNHFEPLIAPLTPNDIDVVDILDSFMKAREAAKVVDELTGQPDCVDPEKAKLIERVAELEKLIAKKVYVVKLGSLYWGFANGYYGWVSSQRQAFRFESRKEAGGLCSFKSRIVKLVKKNVKSSK